MNLTHKLKTDSCQIVGNGYHQAGLLLLIDNAIFFGLILFISLTAIPYGTVEPWWEAAFECAIFGLGALWIMKALIEGTWQLNVNHILLPLLLLIAFIFIQTLPLPIATASRTGPAAGYVYTISADPYETWRLTLKLLSITLAGVLLLNYTSNERRLRVLVYCVILIGIASALFGLIRQVSQTEPGFILPHLTLDKGSYGQFINKNHFAFLMEMTLGLTLGLIFGRGVSRERTPFFLCIALTLWATLIMSNSRGGILGMLVQILSLPLILNFIRPSTNAQGSSTRIGRWWSKVRGYTFIQIILTLFLLAIVIIGVAWVGGDSVADRLATATSDFSEDGSRYGKNTSRKDMWHSSWELAKAYPVAGIGFGGYWIAITAYHEASGMLTPRQAHNDYLELLASCGIIGALLIAWLTLKILRRSLENLQSEHPFQRAACFGALLGMLGVGVHSFVDFGLHVTINALIFTSLIVIAIVNVNPALQKQQQSNIGSEFPSPESQPHIFVRHRIVLYTGAIISLIICLWFGWTAGRIGYSRLLVVEGLKSNLLDPVNKAVHISPLDPETHSTRGLMLWSQDRQAEAMEEFQRAARLRPRDYFLWLQLGMARDLAGEQGAIEALEQAVLLAPHYAQPRWQLGNVLLRAGQRDRAFTELHLAAMNEPTLFPNLIDLAWSAFEGNAKSVELVTQPQTASDKLLLGRFFVKHGKIQEAAALFRAAGKEADSDRNALIDELLAVKSFYEAYKLWLGKKHDGAEMDTVNIAVVNNGGFETEIDLNDTVFNWQLSNNIKGIRFSLDSNEPRAGAHSLRVDFSGGDPPSSIVSQMVLVEVKTRYRLTFSARTEEIVTGGAPLISISDAHSSNERVIAESNQLPKDSNGWQDYAVDFISGDSTDAVFIRLQRQKCSSRPCPIFGRLWLDNFSLHKL